jgi:U3 small nucleolar RNA-associated protein 4
MSVDQIPVKVHRCRFVDYLPAAITALAFPPLPLPSLKGKARATSPLKFPHLAIGRANGNIELAEWSNNNPTDQAPQAWVVFKVYCSFFPMSSRDRSCYRRLYMALIRRKWTLSHSLCGIQKT